jgi:hypothetical protein
LWGKLSRWIFEKSGKNVEFNVQTVVFGLYIGLNFVNLLVKKYIFQYSRKNVIFEFDNVVKYLYNYYILEEKFTEQTIYQRKWSKWRCLFNQ